MDRDMDQREIDRHRMKAGMPWVIFIFVVLPILAAFLLVLLLRHSNQAPHCPNPKTFLESTVPSNCR